MNIGNYLNDILFSLKPKNNRFLFIIVAIVFTILVDSQIGTVSDFIPEYLSSPFGISLFVGLTIFSIFSSFIIINSVKSINSLTERKYAHFKLIFYLILVAQCLITLMLIFVVIQILVFQEYDSVSLFVLHIISYGVWIGIMGLLTRAFILWYRNFEHNGMILVFTFAMIAYIVNGVFGLINQIDVLLQQDPIISSDYVAYFPQFSNFSVGDQIHAVYQISGIIAYILTWIGSIKLLYQNLRKIGKLKFWTMMIISLFYYNITFPLFY